MLWTGRTKSERGTGFCSSTVAYSDCFLIAGRYTLLDHDAALRNLLPVCRAKCISLLIGGVFNSGVLIDPQPGAFFDYERLDDGWRERVLDHGVRQIEPHETGAYWLSRAQVICRQLVNYNNRIPIISYTYEKS